MMSEAPDELEYGKGSAIAKDEWMRRAGPDIGYAMSVVRNGGRAARRGWNADGMFIYYVPAASYPVQTGAAVAHFGEGAMVPYRPYLALKTADGDVATWAPSVGDALALDWYELPAE